MASMSYDVGKVGGYVKMFDLTQEPGLYIVIATQT